MSPSNPGATGDWDNFRELVLFRLDQCHTDAKTSAEVIAALREDLVVLKTKISMYAVVAGAVSSLVVSLVAEIAIHAMRLR